MQRLFGEKKKKVNLWPFFNLSSELVSKSNPSRRTVKFEWLNVNLQFDK